MLSITAEQPPLVVDTSGVIRVAGTRVSLDTVMEAFNEGLTAEEIVQQYPTLRLADVYFTIAYSLNHMEEVASYLADRQVQMNDVRAQNETHFDTHALRSRLLSRRAE